MNKISNQWDWRVYCPNRSCDFYVDLKKENLKKYFDEKFGKEIYETNREYDINIFSDLYDEIMCGKCEAFPLHVINNRHESILNPEKIVPCELCQKPILLSRLRIVRGTKICAICARNNEKTEAQKIKIHNDLAMPKSPPLPPDMKKCGKCGSEATTRYSFSNQQWFVGCSTFPSCWWKKAMPKTVKGKNSSQLYDILSSFEDLMDVALKARKNNDLECLIDINSEFYRRITNKENSGKLPTKTAQQGFKQTEIWISELENKK